MLILQDWSSDEALNQSPDPDPDVLKYGHTLELPTNKNLKSLLGQHCNMNLCEAYGTNLFPFIKPGGISARIPTPLLTEAAINYAIPQIEIISPKIVICLGGGVFNSIRRGLKLSVHKNLSDSIENPFIFGNAWIYAQSHPGGLGRAGRNQGGVDRVSRDWSRMAKLLDT